MYQIFSKRNYKFHYSPLRYPGGKTFLYSFFEKVLKEKKLKKITYVEPYAGGAGAALALLILGKVEKIVINDFDKAIYSFWKAAIFDTANFIKKITDTPISIPEWKKQKKIYQDPDSPELEKGFATFYLNRTNVSGVITGGPIGGMKQEGKYKINARFNKEYLINKINKISLYKNKIIITNQDGLKLINTYLSKKNAFIYLDPPYFDKGATLYLNHYKKDDHEALAKKLNDNPDSNWLLTYDNTENIRSLYTEREIANFTLNYNVYSSRKGEEIMIFSNSLSI